jgi:hypothetical protein
MNHPTSRLRLLGTSLVSVSLLGACASVGSVPRKSPPIVPLPTIAPTVAETDDAAPASAPWTAPAVMPDMRVPAILPIVAAADDYYGFRSGDWDLQLGGTGGSSRNWNGGNVAATASLGYLLTDNLELSVRQSLLVSDSRGSQNIKNGATAVAFDVNFATGPVVPFLGVNFGRLYGDTVVDSWNAAPEGGVKWFVKRDAYVLAMAEYAIQFEDISDVDNGWHDGAFVYTLALGLTF